MAVITLTSAGLEWITQLYTQEKTSSAITIAVGDGSPTGSGLGSEHTTNGFARGSGTAEYSNDTIKILKRFTASGADVQITEAAIYTNDASPILVGYVHYTEFDLDNYGLVKDGYYFQAEFNFNISIGTVSYTYDENTYDLVYSADVSVILSDSGYIDPNLNLCSVGLCFNGKPIRNGSISSHTSPRVGHSWEIIGYTADFTEIQALQAYAGDIQVIKTITGKQHVNSILKPGTFRVYNKSTHVYDVYTYCWIDGELKVDTFGEGWWFSLRIVQSYQGVE